MTKEQQENLKGWVRDLGFPIVVALILLYVGYDQLGEWDNRYRTQIEAVTAANDKHEEFIRSKLVSLSEQSATALANSAVALKETSVALERIVDTRDALLESESKLIQALTNLEEKLP